MRRMLDPVRGRRRLALAILSAVIPSWLLAADLRAQPALQFLGPPGVAAEGFPRPYRPFAEIISPIWRTEAERDAVDETGQLAHLLGIGPGSVVADIGAGSGYHTMRLARLVGPSGRILAQDVMPAYLAMLSAHVKARGLTNVVIGRGEPHDPRLPPRSVDVAIMVHMYHEIPHPFAFMTNLAPALKPDAKIGIVDLDAETWDHGTPPALLECELAAVGYRQLAFHRLKKSPAYLAIFAAPLARDLTPSNRIVPCRPEKR